VPTPIDLGAAEALIRAQILALLGDVADVGQIYGFVRNVQHEATRNALLADATDGVLRFWFVTLGENPLLQERDGTVGRGWLTYDLHGYRAVSDANASELDFVETALDVVTLFNGSQKLKRAGVPLAGVAIQDSGPVQLPQFDHVTIADVLCHHARIEVRVRFSVGDC
jgi:hypothetical protein